MNQDRLSRINELARLARQRDLTPQEQEEQQKLRQEYIAGYKQSLQAQLDSMVVVDKDGNKTPLKPKK